MIAPEVCFYVLITDQAKVEEPGVIDLIEVLSPLARKIFVIGAKKEYFHSEIITDNPGIHFHNITHRRREKPVARIFSFVWAQVRIAYNIIRISRSVDVVLGIGSTLILPALASKMLGKKTILISTGSAAESSKYGSSSFSDRAFAKIVTFLENLCLHLVNVIVIYEPSFISHASLGKYRDKISIAHQHYINFDEFKIQNPLAKRDNLIGFIGRLSPEKGILNFVEAIPEILQLESSVRFLIAGDGQLWDEIGLILDKQNLRSRVSLINWIPHKEIPKHLNELKLLVLPSYTEGLPNIVLEAMACGTPVLVTAVGGIPDIIRDNETGFILTDNSPKTIASSIVKILSHTNLNKIARNARSFVESNFDYQTAVESYRNVLARLL